MSVHWGLLPLASASALFTLGLFVAMRHEQRTGVGLRFFVRFEGWQREKAPDLWRVRQGFNLVAILITAAATLCFLLEMFGILGA